MSSLPDCMYDYRFEYPIAKIVDVCDCCDYEIAEGESYYIINDIIYCEECIKEFKRT